VPIPGARLVELDDAIGLDEWRTQEHASITLNIAAFAPVPSASITIAAAVKPGERCIVRSAKRVSWTRSSTHA
jgi:hypothetical protein